jgi:hypothetical protein
MLHYLVDMGQGLYGGAGFLHEEDKGEVIFLDLVAMDDLRSGDHAFTGGVGGKIIVLIPRGSRDEAGTLTLGGFVNYQIPTLRALSVQGELYYGPSVTSNNVDGMGYYRAALELEVIERAKLHIGYRKIEAKYGNARFDADEGINVGIKLEF